MMNTHKTEYVTKHEYSEKNISKFHKYQDKFNWDNVLHKFSKKTTLK